MADLIVDIDDRQLSRLFDRTKKGRSIINKHIVISLEKQARLYKREVKKVTPVDTGRLKRGWRLAVQRRKQTATVFNPVPYGIFVNDGTRFIKPRRFVERALRTVRLPNAKITKEELDKAMRKLFRIT